jgi:hypothetical protein
VEEADGDVVVELLGEDTAQVCFVHGCGWVLRHHRVAVQATDVAGEGGVVVAEGGVPAEAGLGRRDRDGAVAGELVVQQLDSAADTADRG